ncbi:MAG TPA: hypothetical protein VJH03_09730 [Blastocatellia bacterium]|nr:hypothetical protein [Blastocatellia bacterium]
MVELTSLWLPIVLSAAAVFVVSSILHMVLTYHRSDYRKLPGEDKVLEAMRNEGVGPGNYHFPYAPSHKEMGSPEMVEKLKKGPVGLMNVMPAGPPAMGKYLALWFIFCLVISVFVAYVAGRTLKSADPYLTVFRLTGTVAFVGYGIGQIQDSIWKGQSWGATVRTLIDGLIYGLVTAGFFGWLWPR